MGETIHIQEQVRDQYGDFHTPLDPTRSLKYAFADHSSNTQFSLSGKIYTPGSGKTVYIRKIILTDLSSSVGYFQLEETNLSATRSILSQKFFATDTTQQSGKIVRVFDVEIGPTTAISGQYIGAASGDTIMGQIGLVIQIDPQADE